MGKGFKIPEVYRTGYTVIGLSIITSIAVAFLLWAQDEKRREEHKGEEGRECGLDALWEFCVYVQFWPAAGPIVLNKGLYYAVLRKGVVMFCPLELIMLWKAFGSSNAARVQSACKCDPVYFILALRVNNNNNRRPKLDVSYMLYPYVICLIVLWRQIH